MINKSNQTGIALLVVLMCLSILTFIVLDNLPQSSITLETTKSYASKPQLEQACFNAASLASKLLLADLDDNKFDCLTDRWAEPALHTFEFEKSKINVAFSIHDEDGKWPINALYKQNNKNTKTPLDIRHHKILKAILKPSKYAEDIEENLIDTMQSIYKHKFFRLSSLRQVPYMDSIYNGIKQPDDKTQWLIPPLPQFISVYSSHDTININTAPKYLLMAIFADASASTIDDIMQQRIDEPFTSTKDLTNIIGVSPNTINIVRALLGVKSSIFRVDVLAKTTDRQLLRSFFIKRNQQECSLLFWADNLSGVKINPKY